MQRRMSVGILAVASLIGCTHMAPSDPAQPATPAETPTNVPASSPTPAKLEPSNTAPVTSAAAVPAPIASGSRNASAPANAAAPAVAAAAAANPAANIVATPPVKKPVAAATSPRTVAPQTAAAHSDNAPAAKAQAGAAPALDLAALEQRLKDTHAIGVFSKLSLKNQVDDLLAQFKAFYGGQARTSLTELRQRYDLLLLKVLSLLQDGDPPLASAISTSREAIWGVLADKEKFQKILSS